MIRFFSYKCTLSFPNESVESELPSAAIANETFDKLDVFRLCRREEEEEEF